VATVPAGLEDLEHHGRPREARGLPRREAMLVAADGAGFAAAATLLAVLGDSALTWHWDVGAALTAAFALAVRARFDNGTGYALPVQLVFVPALLISPPQFAPLIALVGWTLGRVPDVLRGETHASRLLLVPGNCWFAIGPALVLTLAGGDGPSWGDWPIYLLALAAQFAGDVVANAVRDRVVFGVPPELQLRILGYTWSIDLALSPIGLLAAFASTNARFAFLAVLPLAWLLVIFSNERTRRFEAEQAGTRAREALIAGASHELQTPLAVLSGLVDTLARTPRLSEERRRESYDTMARQTAHLRHLVGQFVDYARLKAGQELLVSPRPTDVAPALRAVAELWRQDDIAIEVQAEEVSALVDSARLTRIVMSLVSNAVKHGPAQGPIRLTARRDGRRVVIEVADRGPGLSEDRLEEVFDEFAPAAERSEGSGVGLFLARTALRAQGGDVRLRNDPAGGLVATVYLPVTPR
jgi:signal transduction histidine kinase